MTYESPCMRVLRKSGPSSWHHCRRLQKQCYMLDPPSQAQAQIALEYSWWSLLCLIYRALSKVRSGWICANLTVILRDSSLGRPEIVVTLVRIISILIGKEQGFMPMIKQNYWHLLFWSIVNAHYTKNKRNQLAHRCNTHAHKNQSMTKQEVNNWWG